MTATDRAITKPLKWPIFIVCVVVMLLAYLAMPHYEVAADADGYMLRVTARLAFCFLLLAMVARPLMQLTGHGRVLVQHRRYLGLAMALTHTVHFYFVVRVVLAMDEPLGVETIVGAGLAFVLTWLMAATSNNASVRLLGRNWRRLHLFGLYYVWFIFMLTFAGRLSGDQLLPLYWAIVGLGLAALLLRIYVYWWRRRNAATR